MLIYYWSAVILVIKMKYGRAVYQNPGNMRIDTDCNVAVKVFEARGHPRIHLMMSCDGKHHGKILPLHGVSPEFAFALLTSKRVSFADGRSRKILEEYLSGYL